MNELQKMKLRMSRNIEGGPPGAGGSSTNEGNERAKKYDTLKEVPSFFEGAIGGFAGIEDQLYGVGFQVDSLSRTSLGKPFEPEEFELFLFRLVSCVYKLGDRIQTLEEEVKVLKNKG